MLYCNFNTKIIRKWEEQDSEAFELVQQNLQKSLGSFINTTQFTIPF
jgi:hypothetical protein